MKLPLYISRNSSEVAAAVPSGGVFLPSHNFVTPINFRTEKGTAARDSGGYLSKP
jgi:hypothetical protein